MIIFSLSSLFPETLPEPHRMLRISFLLCVSISLPMEIKVSGIGQERGEERYIFANSSNNRIGV